MAAKRSRTSAPVDDAPSLRHVLVVGGTLAQWNEMTDEQWIARRTDLAKPVAYAGAMWLTLRPFEPGPPFSVHGPLVKRRIDLREGCTVIVDPEADGRQRLLHTIDHLRHAGVAVIDENALTGAMMAPAPCEPDLTVVLGASTRLPPSLVWDLAYSELVFLDVAWADLSAAHIERAADEFSRRHRRFGGIG